MASFSNMYSSLGINIQNFSRGLRQATTQINNFATNARSKINQAAGGFNTASDNVSNFGRNLRGQTSSAMEAMEDLKKSTNGYEFTVKSVSRIVSGIMISQAFYRIVQDVRAATQAVWEFSKQLEYAQIAYSNLFGDTALASEFINVLKDFAAKTPFTFSEAEASAKRLLAYGIEYKNVMYVMQGVLAAASMQGDPTKIESISRALGQIYTYGKLMTQEVRQLSEAGIPAYEILQEELGLTQEQLRNLGNEGISASVAINALVDGMQKRFGNVVQASSMTITGIISNIKDNATMLFAGIFEPLTVFIKSALAALGSFLFTLRDIEETAGPGGVFEALFPPELHSTIRLFIANLKMLLNTVAMLFASVRNLLQPVLVSVMNVFNAFAPILNGVVSALTAVLYIITSNSTAMKVLTAMLTAAAAMWVVFKLNALASLIVTGVITAISKSLAGLAAVLTFVAKHPFWSLMIGLAGVVIGLSSGFGNLSKKVSNFFKQLTSFNGVDADSILMPSQEDRANDLEKFNNALDGTSDAMDELADSTDKAGQAAKKSMQGLLSFDEVFKLNEPDETTGTGTGSGDIDTSGIDDLLDGIGSVGSGFMPEVPDFSAYMDGIKEAFLTPFTKLWGDLEGIMTGIISTSIGAALGGALGFILGGPLGAKIGDAIGGLVGGLWGMIAEQLNIQPTQHLATIISGLVVSAIKGAFPFIKEFISQMAMFSGYTSTLNVLKNTIKTSLKASIKQGIIGAIVGLGVGMLSNAITGWIAKELELVPEDLENAGTGQLIGNIIGSLTGLILGGPTGSIIGGAIGQLGGSIIGEFWNYMSNALKGTVIGGAAGLPIGALVGTLVGSIGGPLGAALGAAIGAGLGAIGGLLTEYWDDMSNTLRGTVIGLFVGGPIGPLVGMIMDHWEPIKTFFTDLGTSISGFFENLGGWITTGLSEIGGFFESIGESISDAYETVTDFLEDVKIAVSDFFEPVTSVFEDIKEAVTTVWDDMSLAIETVLNDIGEAIDTAWNDILAAITTVLMDIWGAVSGIFFLIKDIIVKYTTDAFIAVRDKFLQISETIEENLIKAWNTVKEKFISIYNTISSKVLEIYNYVKTWFVKIFNAIKEPIVDAYNEVKKWFTNIYDVIKTKVLEIYNYVKTWFVNIYTTIRDNVKKAYDAVKNYFKDMYDSVKEKINGMYSSVKEGTKNMYTTFKNWVSDLYNDSFGKLFGWLDDGIEKIREFLNLDSKAGSSSSTNKYNRTYGVDTGHATGGIFNREHIARFAEGNKAEAVIPLENASAMQPFVDAISRGILEGLAPTLVQSNGRGNSENLPPMYVGTLVADERGLKQLYRKFELIKVQEDARKGLAYT